MTLKHELSAIGRMNTVALLFRKLSPLNPFVSCRSNIRSTAQGGVKSYSGDRTASSDFPWFLETRSSGNVH